MHMQSKRRKNKSSGGYFSHRSLCFYLFFPFSFYYFWSFNEKVRLYISVSFLHSMQDFSFCVSQTYLFSTLDCIKACIFHMTTFNLFEHDVSCGIIYEIAHSKWERNYVFLNISWVRQQYVHIKHCPSIIVLFVAFHSTINFLLIKI